MAHKKGLLKILVATKIEIKWWSYAAWTLPFVALAIITFESYFGFENYVKTTLTISSIMFFTICVYWWWWALNKIGIILSYMHKTDRHIEEVITEIKETRKAIQKEFNDSNRQR